jgi:hypothetical protein
MDFVRGDPGNPSRAPPSDAGPAQLAPSPMPPTAGLKTTRPERSSQARQDTAKPSPLPPCGADDPEIAHQSHAFSILETPRAPGSPHGHRRSGRELGEDIGPHALIEAGAKRRAP